MAKKVILKDDNVEIMPITRGELVLDSSGQLAFHSSQFLATQSLPGLMSAADKTKLDNTQSAVVDTALSTTSTNAVLNKVITTGINEAKTLANNALDAADDALDTANSAQGIANAIKASYLKSASVSGNLLTLIDLDDEETKFNNTTYTFESGSNGSFTVTPVGGTAQTVTVGGVLTDAKVKQTNTTSSGSYRLLFSYTADNTTRTEGARKSSKLLFNPDTGALTATSFSGNLAWSSLTGVPETFAPSAHNHTTSQINALTSYSKATSASDLATTDTLNVALGKLEYKADTAYTWYKSITDTDTDDVINKWSEVVDFVNNLEDDVLETFVTTNTKQTITGEKTFSGTSASLLNIDRNSTNPAWIRFLKNGTLLGYLGVSNDNKALFNNGSNTYDILHSGNSHIKSGVITINGATITPITSHQSLSNYVTLTGNQEISGVKTFTSQQKFTVAQGTSPFTVTSKTTVANLSAALLDGTSKGNLLTGFANVNTTDNPNSVSVTVGGTTKYLKVAYSDLASKVVCSASTGNHDRPILVTNLSNGVYYSTKVKLNYSTGNVTAPTFTGALKGNADTATTASKLSTVSKTAWGLTYWTSGGVPASISGDMTGVGNITIASNGNVDRFITFDTTSTRNWRIGYLGTGSDDANYLIFQSTKTLTIADGWYDMLKIGCETGNAILTGLLTAKNFVSGDGINDFSAGTVKLDVLNIPTSNGGTTFGPGSNGQVLKSNGTTVYWASDNNSNSWRAVQVNGTQIAGTGTGTYAMNFVSGTGITVAGTSGSSSAANSITITNAGVRSVTINGNYLRVNTNGTNNDLTIPYATKAGRLISNSGTNLGGLSYYYAGGIVSSTDKTGAFAGPTSSTIYSSVLRLLSHTTSGGLYYRDLIFDINSDSIWSRRVTKSGDPVVQTLLHSGNYKDYVDDMYWANVKISATSNAATTPTFATATATTQVTTPKVHSSGRLTLNTTSTGLDLKFNNDNAKSVILIETAFKPFDDANGNLNLGTSDARWKSLYAGTGNFTGNVTLISSSGDSPKLRFVRGGSVGDSGKLWDWLMYSSSGRFYLQVDLGTNSWTTPFFINTLFNVGINTTSPSYRLHVAGDTYTSGWSRAASGFYVLDTGVYFSNNGTTNYGEIACTSGNEFMWGSSDANLFFNYRAASRGTTVTNFVWNAGSSSTYASHTLGNLTTRGTIFFNSGDATLKIYSGRITDAKSDGNICFQTCIDALDGQSHAYAVDYQSRCNISLLPRGGLVYIGTNPDGGNTSYKLYVNGKVYSTGYTKSGSSDSYVLLGGGGHKLLSDFSMSHSHPYIPLAGGTMSSGSAQIQRAGSAVSWYLGRTNAMIRINSYTGYNAIASMKTTNGDWSLGVYSNNILYFTYFTDTNVNGAVNTPTTQIYMNPSGLLYAGSFYTTSDEALKFNILNINNSDNIPQLKEFDWKQTGKHSYGLIALELEEMGYVELVSNEGPHKTVDYQAALSLIVGKLQVKIKELEKEIEELKNK